MPLDTLPRAKSGAHPEPADAQPLLGKRIAEFQMVSEKLARMAMEVESVRTMVWSQAFRMAKEGPAKMALETAATKLLASETALQNALDATQIFGGYGYMREFPVERYLRDARIMTIGAGTSEIMCNLIFKELEKRY